ncbi:hypothetical protein C9374_008082 [Naegleria lovaniensis]|uniref:Uncharacterized protein n=1 Tax=Naegleria lovaniensis TaxID=51637 RepID=A0AA88GLM2_NAELO|nr:uncharacterized protein C9374_008082 [Naegleria lovaniensis]KAG2378443.1 hypothetical protein C9374_008082 [Naegleria lovaniensis]
MCISSTKKDSVEFLSTESENEIVASNETLKVTESKKSSSKSKRNDEKTSDLESEYPRSRKTSSKEKESVRDNVPVTRSREEELKQRYHDLKKAYRRVYGAREDD